jgi:hypothetical protein
MVQNTKYHPEGVSSMGVMSYIIIGLGVGCLVGGFFIGNVHFDASLGPIFASGVLITLGLLLKDTGEGVDSDTYKVYAYFLAAIGAVAVAVAGISGGKIAMLVQQSGLDLYLELGIALIGAASALILLNMVKMLRALSPKYSAPVEVEVSD